MVRVVWASKKPVWRCTRIFLAAYAGMFAVLLAGRASGWNEANYFRPDFKQYATAESVGAESVFFPSRDGKLKLHGWFLRAQGPCVGTILHSHGNAQNLTAHVNMVRDFTADGFNVFVFDYRGFGASEGELSITGALSDCHAALDYALSRPDVDREKVAWLGQSLGGALAVLVAVERREIKALAVDSAFTSFQEMAAVAMRRGLALAPLSPLAPWLIGDVAEPAREIGKIAPRPVLVFCGAADRVVPPEMSRELFARAREPKEFKELENSGHLDALNSPEIRRWVAERFRGAFCGK